MPSKCPKCGASNKTDRSTCVVCGAELELALFSEMFGPPRRLKARYVVQRPATRGATVSVYHAIDTRNRNAPCMVHQVALTSLAPQDREMVEHRFLQRAALWQERQHPNLLRILDADVSSHRLYLITEPIEGTSLSAIARDRRQIISEQTLLHWAGQLCDLLDYLHGQDPALVVGCLSPGAIHVTETGHLKLIEVGLIRYKQSGLLGSARGVRGYGAPEQRDGQPVPQSDLYAVGMILYRLITRADPKQRPLPPIKKYAQGFSDRTLEAVARATRSDAGKRFTTAVDLRQALVGDRAYTDVDLPPFALSEVRTATTLPQLLQLCVAHWDDGLLALMTGRIAEWLSNASEALLEQGRQEDAVRTRGYAQRTVLAREQVDHNAARPGITASAREIAHNAAYASWLQDMGAVGVQPALRIQPTQFDFGVVGARIKARSTLLIRNGGQGYLSGRVASQVPWLVVPDPIFGCRAGATVEVQVEALGRHLSTGDTASRQALRITSSGGDAWIEARASSSPPVLGVTKRVIDFGPVTRGASRVQSLAVVNTGGGRLNGTVVSRAPWLRIRHPSFSCPAGASAQVAVEILSADLPKGAVRIRNALVVDSDSGQAQIDVTWRWARPSLELDSTGIDLGSVQRGTRVERVLALTNSGTADLVGTCDSRVPWLTVEPQQFRLPPGASQPLTVHCDTSVLPGGATVEPAALVVVANAGEQTISASVEVQAPYLVIEPDRIDLGAVRDGDRVEDTIMVGNHGSMPWRGEVRATVPWLSVETQEVFCEPGHFIPVTLVLHTEDLETGGVYEDGSALEVVGMGDLRTVGVRAELLRPELAVKRHSLDLGLIGRTDIVTVPLDLTNSGTGNLEWRIAVQGTWLEIVPSAGTCGTGETAVVQVKAYALAVEGEQGQAWLTVHSNGGRADLTASVTLSSPLLVVEPLYLDLQSENHTPASQAIHVSNRGVGRLEGTVASLVPWLRCSPTAFTCDTGVSAQIVVDALLDDLRESTYSTASAIRIESDGGGETVEATLHVVLRPVMGLSVDTLDMHDVPRASFELANRGEGTLRAEVIPMEDWIAVNRRDWSVKGGKHADVRVWLQNAPTGAQGEIEVRTADERIRLTVHT